LSEQPLPRLVLVDANFLVRAISKKKPGDDEHKALHLLERVEKARGQIVIPTAALAEYLVLADAASLPLLDQLERKACIRLVPFDRAAAYECANLDAAAKGRGDKKDGSSSCWQKIKVDRQIVAIAKASGVGLIVSDDQDVHSNASRVGIRATTITALPLPDRLRQGTLRLSKGK